LLKSLPLRNMRRPSLNLTMAGIVVDSIVAIVSLSIDRRKRWLPLIYKDKEVVHVRSGPLIKEAGRNGLGTREGRGGLTVEGSEGVSPVSSVPRLVRAQRYEYPLGVRYECFSTFHIRLYFHDYIHASLHAVCSTQQFLIICLPTNT
jgi:hypothetical protein